MLVPDAKKISYDVFLLGLGTLAEKKGVTNEVRRGINSFALWNHIPIAAFVPGMWLRVFDFAVQDMVRDSIIMIAWNEAVCARDGGAVGCRVWCYAESSTVAVAIILHGIM